MDNCGGKLEVHLLIRGGEDPFPAFLGHSTIPTVSASASASAKASNGFSLEPRLLATPRMAEVSFEFAATQEFGLAWATGTGGHCGSGWGSRRDGSGSGWLACLPCCFALFAYIYIDIHGKRHPCDLPICIDNISYKYIYIYQTFPILRICLKYFRHYQNFSIINIDQYCQYCQSRKLPISQILHICWNTISFQILTIYQIFQLYNIFQHFLHLQYLQPSACRRPPARARIGRQPNDAY